MFCSVVFVWLAVAASTPGQSVLPSLTHRPAGPTVGPSLGPTVGPSLGPTQTTPSPTSSPYASQVRYYTKPAATAPQPATPAPPRTANPTPTGTAMPPATAMPTAAPAPTIVVPPPPVIMHSVNARPASGQAVSQPARMQGPGLPGGPGQPGGGMTKDFADYRISFDEPSPERLFRFESEKNLERRMQQEARQRATPTTVVFPEQPTISQVAFAGRSFPRQQLTAEPYYVNHARLYFQQINAERYGWDLGPLHPLVSAARFYGEVLIWPYRVFANFCDQTESSAGRCLPGDPVPLLLYPPELLSLQGGIGQALITVPLAIAIP